MTLPTSVVVVSYNNYERTAGPCLKSLLADEDSEPFEIVVVDNNSSDGTAERLQRAVGAQPRVKLILNRTNRGFAGGNNDGVAAASGQIVVLLNSDTLVPPKAIEALSQALQENPAQGLLGPVTNAAGNEQKIFTCGPSPDAILEEGRRWCRHANSTLLPSRRLDFFCVAIVKEVYRDLGGLDEAFGPGYFEDTDFSLRALKAGVAMGFSEAVFVYHCGGQSFSRQGRDYVHRLMRINRRHLRAKHPEKIELRHLRDCNLEVMNHYSQQARTISPPSKEGLAYRFDNRWQLARTLDPRGPLKRWGYHRRLSRCADQFNRAMGWIV